MKVIDFLRPIIQSFPADRAEYQFVSTAGRKSAQMLPARPEESSTGWNLASDSCKGGNLRHMLISHSTTTTSEQTSGAWLTQEQLPSIRSLLLGVTLLVGLLIWVTFS